MTTDKLSVIEVHHSDESTMLDVGSSGSEMFYWLNPGLCPVSNHERWSQPIPDRLSSTEAGYYALVKGLQAASDMGYQKVLVAIDSVPILDHLRKGVEPPPELRPAYEKANDLREQFEQVDLFLYGL